MYWPIGTPRIFATAASGHPASLTACPRNVAFSHDGLLPHRHDKRMSHQPSHPATSAGASADAPGWPSTPMTPATPATPAINSVEHEYPDGISPESPPSPAPAALPLNEPVLALRVARQGHIFAVISSTSMTIWQTKPSVILALVVRSEASLRSYGTNTDLLLRPDSAILVLHTSLGFLITYSLATDAESHVYTPYFTSHTNVQRRRQAHAGGPGHAAPDRFLWGPGEGPGARDVSVRFRMVIKVDAGIESALALDDELVVATRKPAAVQCIRWTPDSSGTQTSTELLSRMAWMESRKITVREMTHDRPMNLSTWITSDGKAYAVQRMPGGSSTTPDTAEPVDFKEPQKLFKGYCFHLPQDERSLARKCVINARFSLIAVACADATIHVYVVRNYSGDIPPSHVHKLAESPRVSGPLTTLSYSPDGYCLFAGFEHGWAMWSVYGKSLSNTFNGTCDLSLAAAHGEAWLSGVTDAAWVSGACEILMAGRSHEAIWLLELARSAVTTCFGPANLFRTVLQSTAAVMVYRGYDLPDLTSISVEPSVWHTARIPATYLLNQWPIRCAVVSPDGRYVAVAGRRGLAHYSINSGRWKTFVADAAENEFQVRGGMCWYQNIVVAAIEVAGPGRILPAGQHAGGGSHGTYELRLYSREAALDSSTALDTHRMLAPVVLITPSGEDSLLVYTKDNLLHHFLFAPAPGGGSNTVRLVRVGHIAFHGIIRSPQRVRGLGWILPEKQLLEGDPSQDVVHASVFFLVDGKLVLLRPSVNHEGHLKYDMRVIAHNVEYYVCMRDQPMLRASLLEGGLDTATGGGGGGAEKNLLNSLWMFDGSELKAWTDLDPMLGAVSTGDGLTSREMPPMTSIPLDFYPLSILLGKATVLGVEPELVQRRDISFSFFRFSLRTHLFLPDMLRFYLAAKRSADALSLAQQYQKLAYFAHALEILLHHVLDEEVDAHPPPAPEHAILPRVLSLLSSFRQYLDIVVQCTRKTEVRSWRTLFAYLPPPQELFEESLQRGDLKTAGGYLLVLHTFDELSTASEQSVRLLSRAMSEEEWELCRELARFLAASDESGNTLRAAMDMVNGGAGANGRAPSELAMTGGAADVRGLRILTSTIGMVQAPLGGTGDSDGAGHANGKNAYSLSSRLEAPSRAKGAADGGDTSSGSSPTGSSNASAAMGPPSIASSSEDKGAVSGDGASE